MKYTKHQGIIINRYAVGDSDRYYRIMTQESGKISVYARAVRTIKSKRGSSLDLFSHINFEVARRGERSLLTHVDLITSFAADKKSLHNIARLFQIGELIDALLPEDDPHQEVYELLHQALTHLSRFETSEYLLRFKKRLLKLLGYEKQDLQDREIDEYIESLISRRLSPVLN